MPANPNTGADGKNRRRALDDIVDVTMVGRGEIDPKKISRPVTSPKLLADAQAAAAGKKVEATSKPAAPLLKTNNQCRREKIPSLSPQHLLFLAGAATKAKVPIDTPRKPAPKPPLAPRKVLAKPPKPKTVKIIHGNGGEEKEAKKMESTQQAFRSILSARSKATGELDEKEKEKNIIDVDAGDTLNELAVVEYVEDMHKYYMLFENYHRAGNYIGSQTEINEEMRTILVDWLIGVQDEFGLTLETFYLTVNIIDRYLTSRLTPRREFQLVGVAATLIASKYEEIWAPEVNDLVHISDRAYSHKEILKMEKRILEELAWTITVPTPYVFLVRFIKVSSSSSGPDKHMENLSYFLAELGMINYYIGVIYCPSMIAASAVFVARCTLGKKPRWNETLKFHTRYMSENELMDCAMLLVKFHSLAAADHNLKFVFNKYSSIDKGAVALIPPAKFLLGSGGSS